MIKKRNLIFLVGFILSIWIFSLVIFSKYSLFYENWPMSLTMIFGSLIAGATSEGGGAIAFPVMTLLFKIKPTEARDFSLMIQSFGMLVASSAIVFYRIKIMKPVITWASLGGAFGVFFGLYFLNNQLPADFVKMFFTSFWLSFCIVLLLYKNRNQSRSLKRIQPKIIISLGFIGGIVSSIVGTGIDIILFAFLTLYAGVDPKVATPTSVILMGINSFVGFLLRWFLISPPLGQQSWDFLYVCIPVVVIGAPLGSLFISNKSKEFIERFLILSIVTQFIGSLIIIKQSFTLALFSISTILIGSFIFFGLAHYGLKSSHR